MKIPQYIVLKRQFYQGELHRNRSESDCVVCLVCTNKMEQQKYLVHAGGSYIYKEREGDPTMGYKRKLTTVIGTLPEGISGFVKVKPCTLSAASFIRDTAEFLAK